MSDSGAFVRAFKAEMKAAQHDALVELYSWANRIDYGANPGLAARAEAWATQIESCGLGMAVLEATAADEWE